MTGPITSINKDGDNDDDDISLLAFHNTCPEDLSKENGKIYWA